MIPDELLNGGRWIIFYLVYNIVRLPILCCFRMHVMQIHADCLPWVSAFLKPLGPTTAETAVHAQICPESSKWPGALLILVKFRDRPWGERQCSSGRSRLRERFGSSGNRTGAWKMGWSSGEREDEKGDGSAQCLETSGQAVSGMRARGGTSLAYDGNTAKVLWENEWLKAFYVGSEVICPS